MEAKVTKATMCEGIIVKMSLYSGTFHNFYINSHFKTKHGGLTSAPFEGINK
jgi:hypothetical protein